jgi:hypothetical protein
LSIRERAGRFPGDGAAAIMQAPHAKKKRDKRWQSIHKLWEE